MRFLAGLGLLMCSITGEAQNTPAPAFPLEQLTTCRESWLDWKDDAATASRRGDSFRAQFRQGDRGAFFVPISTATVMGLPVIQVYPNSVGMAVGFSVEVKAPFDSAKKAVEKSIGKPMKPCETSEGTRTCELEVGVKKTVMLMSDAAGKSGSTLIGCFYYYEK